MREEPKSKSEREKRYEYQCLQECSTFFILYSQGCIKFFEVSSETKFIVVIIIIFSTTPSFQNFGTSFHLGAVSNGLIGLVEGPALLSKK